MISLAPVEVGSVHSVYLPAGTTVLPNNTSLSVVNIVAAFVPVRHIGWDDDGTGAGPVGMLVMGPVATAGRYCRRHQYANTLWLRLVPEIWGVAPLKTRPATRGGISFSIALQVQHCNRDTKTFDQL